MRQATDSTNTSVASGNVVALPLTPDTYITAVEARAAQQAASILPPWFTVTLIEDEDEVANRRQDHLRLERIAGPPIGCFSVLREGRQELVVYATGERDNQWSDHYVVGRCRSLLDALRIVRDHLDTTIASWNLPRAS